MATSAMEAALSIISLVIFAAPCACACAHNTPGNSVPASPIPEHVFMKFRRSSILILSFMQPRGRARKIAHHPFGPFALFCSRKCMGPEQRRWPSFLFSGTKLNVVRFRIPKGVSMMRFKRFFVFLPLVLLSFPLRHLHAVTADDPPTAAREVVLKAADISPKIFPERVFFRGQSAPVQFRNSGGVHF